MTKQDSTTEQSCWHCGVVVIPERVRCENCPSECDVEGCQEMGCGKSEEDSWCDDCHGYTHTSTCPHSTTGVEKDLLSKFAEHKDWCNSETRYPSPPCDCGLVESINSYDSLRSQNEALREALGRMVNCFSPFSSEDTERYREEWEAFEMANTLLEEKANNDTH